ncbi:MAG: glycosyltransferase family 39 protein [Anaerolineales bacterium]|jgi:hypothetical protein
MTRAQIIILFSLGVAVALAAGMSLENPGYMDAEYYFVTGRELSIGNGFQEPFIWNYLSSPQGLPHPSHGYWMPFASLIAALPMSLVGSSFRAAQIPFILLTALLPLLTSRYSYSLHQDNRAAFLAGLLAAVPGFFLPYFLTTDMFILYAWIGTAFFWSMHLAWKRRSALLWIFAGVCIGLAHLSRADGFLFLFPFLYFIAIDRERLWRRLGLAGAGYCLVMVPWFLRNLQVFGALLPPGNQSVLWMRSYEDLFRYPATGLNPTYLLDTGLASIISARLEALWINLQRVVAENCLVFLLPFMVIGFLTKRGSRVVRSAALYWLILFVVMSVVFPFAGAQGGTFHSSAALMPTLWMLIPFGLRKAVAWIGARRKWDIPQATINFGWIMVVLAALFTTGVYLQRVYGFEQPGKTWSSDTVYYSSLGRALADLEPEAEIVMVNNPPGLYAVTGIKSVVVPSGGQEALSRALIDFKVDYLVLDRNHPSGLTDLFGREEIPEGLKFVEQLNTEHYGPALIFRSDMERNPE